MKNTIMTKTKTFCMILCVMLLISSVSFAESASRDGWEICADHIIVYAGEEVLELAPYLLVRSSTPKDDSSFEISLEIHKAEESIGGIWIEETEEAGRLTFSNSGSCTCVTPGCYLHLLMMISYLNMDFTDDELMVYRYLPNVLPIVDEFLGNRELLDSILGALGAAEREGDTLHCRIPLMEGLEISFDLCVTYSNDMPELFDMTQKTDVALNIREGFFGSEHMAIAEDELLVKLLEDESFMNLFILLSSIPVA